jgi:predicted GH43/DUF377 family glycosyl hydrolase
MHGVNKIGLVLIFLGIKFSVSCSMFNPLSTASEYVTRLDISGNFWEYTAYNDPHVIKIGSVYFMYLTRNGNDKYTDRQEPTCLIHATSEDGVSWNIKGQVELLTLGNSIEWDYNKVETPSVVSYNGEYHMYYSGASENDSPVSYKIGHAVSADGLSWVKDTNHNPVLSPASVKNISGVIHVAEPGAIVFNGLIYLYMTVTSTRQNGESPASKMAIYLSTSSNGYDFSVPVPVLEQGSLYPATSGYNGYSTPSAVAADTGMELYYDVYRHTGNNIAPDEQVKIHRAVSADGIHFTEDNSPILNREDFSWTAREIRGGSELLENGKMKIWFSGDNYSLSFGSWSGGMTLGYAEISR